MKASKEFLASVTVLLMGIAAAAQQTTTSVAIIITDPSGARVPGAKIRVVPAPDPGSPMVTDNKGQLELRLKPGPYALFARAQEFKVLSMHFDVQQQTDPQTVTGVVQLGMGGGPTLVSPATSKDDLTIYAYPYHVPAAFSPPQIKSMPHLNVTVHNPHAKADESYSGVRLADFLSKMNAPLGKERRGQSLALYVIARGSDGYEAVLSLAEVDPEFHSGELLVADQKDGKALDAHDGPLMLVVSEDKRSARWGAQSEHDHACFGSIG